MRNIRYKQTYHLCHHNMTGTCEILLEKDTYRPGESINGKVKCIFNEQCTVRDIKITFSGRAKVYWKEGKHDVYKDKKVYFAMESSLLLCETKFEAGSYEYPFTFELPGNLPSSMKAQYGSVQYKAKAHVDIAWATDCKSKKVFVIYIPYTLTSLETSNFPVDFHKVKLPFAFGVEKSIKINVTLPQDCYAPNEMVSFVAKVKNNSDVKVNEIRFQIVQSFSFHVRKSERKCDGSYGEEFAIIDSVVKPGEEKYWELELRVPVDMFIGTLSNCPIIDVHWMLRGVICLPFPHRNTLLEIPLYFGVDDLPNRRL